MLTQLKWTSSDVLPHKSRGQIYEKSVYQHLRPRRSAVEGSETPDEGLRLCASSGVFLSPPNLLPSPEGKKSKLSVEREGAIPSRLECGLGRGKKRSTVGRQKNLLWVVRPTYRGSFLGAPKRTLKPDRGEGRKKQRAPRRNPAEKKLVFFRLAPTGCSSQNGVNVRRIGTSRTGTSQRLSTSRSP